MSLNTTSRSGLAALLTIAAITLVLPFATKASGSTPVGDWEGKLDTGKGSLRVVLHIS